MLAPTGATRLAAVIGDPVRHSLSPVLLNAAFAASGLDWVYVALEVPEGEVPAAFTGVRALGIGGLSVTMPHKEAAATACDRLSDEAAALGAVNCVVNEGGTLVGHNTDGAGFVAALRAEGGVDPAGQRCVVVGAGGAGRAVALALARAGAARVAVVNRSAERAARAVALLGEAGAVVAPEHAGPEVAEAGLVVNATSVGMGEGSTDLPLDAGAIRPGQVVVDIVYRPLRTPLLRAAEARGATAMGGVPMLVGQAAEAFRLWTGAPPPVDAMARAVAPYLV
jgi:shikimate dehydrogenase